MPIAPVPNDLPPHLATWLQAHNDHLHHLEQELQAARTALQKQTATAQEAAQLKQEHMAFVSAYQQRTGELQQEVQRWQEDYERLRVQKGGFGFKALLATATLALLVGVVAGWLFFTPKEPQAVVFERFRKDAGFQLEYALRQRQFEQAARILYNETGRSSNHLIQPELELLTNLLTAVRQGFAEAQLPPSPVSGYNIAANDDQTPLQVQAPQTLTITEAQAHLHVEAQTSAPVLVTVKKKASLGQWGRTSETEKLPVVQKGVKGVAEDYWYEVETPDGAKGWVFGAFTSASLRRFKPNPPDTLVPVKATPPVVDSTRH